MVISDRYKEIYKKDIKHWDYWLRNLIPYVEKEESLCISAIPKLGVARTLDYYAYKLDKTKNVNLIYSYNVLDLAEDLIKNIDKSSNNIFIIQKYPKRSLEFKRKYTSYVQTNKRHLISIISVDPNILGNSQDLIFNSPELVRNHIILKPLNYEMTRSLIHSREELDDFQMPNSIYKEIYELSGGHGGLLKYIIKYYLTNNDLNLAELRDHPPIKVICEEILSVFEDTKQDFKYKYGLVDDQGEFRSKILRNLVNNPIKGIKTNLNEKQKELLELFLSEEGKLIKKEKIEEVVSSAENYSLWGFYKYMSRFRELISHQFELINVYGKGYYVKRR
jgi:hypothetical protein